MSALIKYFLLINIVIQTSQKWLPEVTGYNKNDENNGYAGIFGKPIIGLRVSGEKEYRVHIKDGDWLPAVTGNDINDSINGYAGKGKDIDAISIKGGNKYTVHILGEGWLPHVSGYNIKDGKKGYAGNIGFSIDALMIHKRAYAVSIKDDINLDEDNENGLSYNPNDLNFTTLIVDYANTCPDNTYSFYLNHSCLKTCPKNYGMDKKLKKCVLTYFDISTTKYEFQYNIINNITQFINQSKIINGSDFTAVISYSDDMNPKEQIENGKSAIDLGKCTQSIKSYYNISNNEKLIIVNMEEKYNKSRENKNDENSPLDFGKNMQIEVYDIFGNQLDLSVCEEEIKVLKYIGDVEELDIQSAKSLFKQGIDSFNRNDRFFNDICHSYKIAKKDIILKDRVSDIYKNVIMCQEGCIYKDINYDLMIANCICNSTMLQKGIDDKTNFYNNKNEVVEKVDLNWIKKILKTSLEQINFNVISCTNLVFDKKILLRNIGFYCMSIMFIMQLIFLFIYEITKLKSLKNFLLLFSNKNFNMNPPKNNFNIEINSKIKNKNNCRSMSKVHFIENEKNYQNNFESKKIDKKIFIKTNIHEHANSQLSEENNNNIILNNYNGNKYEFTKNKIHSKKKKNKKLKKNKSRIHLNFNETNIEKNKSKINKDILVISKFNEYLQELNYEEVIIYDKKTFMSMYFSFLKSSQIIFSTFFTKNYIDLLVIKLSFFIFTFQISFFLNGLFYTEDYISEAYHNNGVLNVISGLPKSIYSFLVTLLTTNLLRMLSSSKSELMNLIIKPKNIQNYINLINILLLKLSKKLIVYFILIVILGLFFLNYITAFCAVYYNSQKYWLVGCIQSFALDSLAVLLLTYLLQFLGIYLLKEE